MCASGVCKIADFGHSKNIDDLHAAQVEIPTQVFWAAPEAIDPSHARYGLSVDVWSTGCITFEMWTGQRPWAGHETTEILSQARPVYFFKLYSNAYLYYQMRQTQKGPPLPHGVVVSQLAEDFLRKCFEMYVFLWGSQAPLTHAVHRDPNRRPTVMELRQHPFVQDKVSTT